MQVNKYLAYSLAVLLVLAGILAGSFGFMWGKSRAENKSLKDEKARYKRISAEQDSIIKVSQGRIIILLDSVNILVEDGVKINSGTDKSREFVKKDKQKMNEELSNIPNLSVGEQLKLFSKQSAEYQPPR